MLSSVRSGVRPNCSSAVVLGSLSAARVSRAPSQEKGAGSALADVRRSSSRQFFGSRDVLALGATILAPSEFTQPRRAGPSGFFARAGDGACLSDGDQAAINFSFASGIASRKVCSGGLAETPTSLVWPLLSPIDRDLSANHQLTCRASCERPRGRIH